VELQPKFGSIGLREWPGFTPLGVSRVIRPTWYLSCEAFFLYAEFCNWNYLSKK